MRKAWKMLKQLLIALFWLLVVAIFIGYGNSRAIGLDNANVLELLNTCGTTTRSV